MARARAGGPLTDGEVAVVVNKIVRAMKQLPKLPEKRLAATQDRILDHIATVEKSQHTNACAIAETLRLDYRDGRVRYMSEGVRRNFEFAGNWFVHAGELHADIPSNREKIAARTRLAKAQTHRILRRAAESLAILA